jgi:hypothetical protein
MRSAAPQTPAERTDSAGAPWQPPTPRQLGLFLFAALLALFCRLPRLLLEGRVYAEEGTTYLRYAWNATPLRALLAPHQGYYSLLDNLCALVAARLLPLSAAALFFTWMAAGLQVLLIYLTVECEVFHNATQRWLALFALLLVTPNLEAWLSLVNCQSILAVAAAVILISYTERLFLLRATTLALGALSSVTTMPLIPFFWLRVWRERSRRAIVFALSITLPALVQSAVLLHAIRAGGRPVSTHELRALAAYASSRVFVLPFTTGRGAQYYDKFLFEHSSTGWILALYLVCIALLALGFMLFQRTSRTALMLYGAALLSTAFDWYGCIPCTYPLLLQSRGGEGRYFFPANSMLVLALLLAATHASRRWISGVAAAIFGWLMITGAFQYVRMRPYLNDYPAWLPQVRRWQADEREPIFIAPSFWQEPLRFSHQHPEWAELPFDAYDSIGRHHVM